MVYRRKDRPSGESLRELLVDEALLTVRVNGADKLSAAAVSEAVGASATACYTHFPDGAVELLAAVAIRGFAKLCESLIGAPPNMPPELRLRDVFQRYIGFGLEDPHLYRAMFSARLAERLGTVGA